MAQDGIQTAPATEAETPAAETQETIATGSVSFVDDNGDLPSFPGGVRYSDELPDNDDIVVTGEEQTIDRGLGERFRRENPLESAVSATRRDYQNLEEDVREAAGNLDPIGIVRAFADPRRLVGAAAYSATEDALTPGGGEDGDPYHGGVPRLRGTNFIQ